MRLLLKRVDKDYYGVNEYIQPIAKQALKFEQFVYTVCEILNVYNQYNPHIVNDVVKALKMAEYRIDDNDTGMLKEYRFLAKLMEEFYWQVVEDENFEKKAKEIDKDLRDPYKRLGQYRGLLLEEIISAAVYERFQNHKFCKGCIVYVDGIMVKLGYGWCNSEHKQTIDIAGWADCEKYGEFYECKVSPRRFLIENYKYFIQLKQVLDAKGAEKYILALASADSRNNLLSQKRALEKEDPECDIDFTLIGREDIFRILNYNIPNRDIIA
ncbi:MAG: hypothetical protein K2G55_18855 [Lachnospiraceae bacterium]|nr:hypothetical protein [Lachnospiraceae bacterium]MDE7200630.1 hypothetical protein [Lachnospiraceae bacterium]